MARGSLWFSVESAQVGSFSRWRALWLLGGKGAWMRRKTGAAGTGEDLNLQLVNDAPSLCSSEAARMSQAADGGPAGKHAAKMARHAIS